MRRLAIFGVAAAISGLLSVAPASAEPAVPYTISGSVTTSVDGSGVGGVCVEVIDSDGNYVGTTVTSSSGAYTFGVAEGYYKVQFKTSGDWPGGQVLDLMPQWYNGKPSETTADTVHVTSTAGAGGVDAVLNPGASVSGVVTDAATGDPLPGVCVGVFTTDFSASSYATTDENGAYTASKLPTSEVIVNFDPNGSCENAVPYTDLVAQWYDHKVSMYDADTVSVTEGSVTTSIDGALDHFGSISGHVTVVGGADAAGVCVVIWTSEGGWTAGATSDANGLYSVGGLVPGNYIVEFDTSGGCEGGQASDYMSQYFNGETSWYAADTVGVTSGQTTSSIDAVLYLSGAIAGTVRDTGGAPLEGICVNVYLDPFGFMGGTTTNSDGTYSVIGLPPGSYAVEFDASGSCTGGTAFYASQWYDDQPSQATADAVTVLDGAETGSIDAALAPLSGSISGTVTAEGGDALSGICVNAYDSAGEPVYGATTGADGTYSLGTVAAGDYTVQFDPTGTCSGGTLRPYSEQWYDGRDSQGTADTVTVSGEGSADSIDAVLVPSGAITGTVTAAGGGAVSGVCVLAASGGSLTAISATAADGTYAMTGLPAGDYTITFLTDGTCAGGTPSNYSWQWYDGQMPPAVPDPVPVTLGQVTGSIDAVLQPSGTIAGAVTDGDGNPLSGICVDAYSTTGGPGGSTRTDGNGEYAIRYLESGTYHVAFQRDCSNQDYAPQWYDGQPTEVTADAVTVTVGDTTGSVDAALTAPGSISGTVTDSHGSRLGGICVEVDLPNGDGIASTTTADDGTYSVSGLAETDYVVGFSSGCGNTGDYITQWYDHRADLETADLVPVREGLETPSIDAVMQATPGVPTGISATAGSGKVLLRWSAPRDVGGGITGYDVEYRKVTSPESDWSTISTSASVTHLVLGGLDNDSQYEFRVRAEAGGPGAWSDLLDATPQALSVSIVSVSGGRSAITVTYSIVGGTWFTAGGAVFTGTVTCTVSGMTAQTCNSSPAAISLVPSGSHTVTVSTTDADGNMASSPPSSSVKVNGPKTPKPPKH